MLTRMSMSEWTIRSRILPGRMAPATLFVHGDVVDAISITPWSAARSLRHRRFATPTPLRQPYSEDRWLGRAMTYSSVKRLLNRCSKRIGYDLGGPHMLRHTFATRLIRGIDCDPVQFFAPGIIGM
jgi:integrase